MGPAARTARKASPPKSSFPSGRETVGTAFEQTRDCHGRFYARLAMERYLTRREGIRVRTTLSRVVFFWRKSRVKSPKSRVTSRESRVESRKSKVASQKSRVGSRERQKAKGKRQEVKVTSHNRESREAEARGKLVHHSFSEGGRQKGLSSFHPFTRSPLPYSSTPLLLHYHSNNGRFRHAGDKSAKQGRTSRDWGL